MRRLLLACFASMVALFVGATAFAVPQAHAIGDYSIDELSTQVTVQTDASVHVIERQTLTFSDRNAGLVWYLHAPENGESVRIASVRVAPVDNGGTLLGDWTRLQMVDVDTQEQGRSPGDTAAAMLRMTTTRPWYSYSIGDGMVRCYFPTGKAAEGSASTAGSEMQPNQSANAESVEDGEVNGAGNGDGDDDAGGNDNNGTSASSDGAANGSEDGDFHTYLVETDYTVRHRIRAFRDVGELYWRYAHDSLPADAYNVSLQVVLPMPPDTDPATVGENVTAWGHGPDEGTFSTGEDGTVTYEVDEVARGNYAEAHILFPASWLPDIAGTANQFAEMRGPVVFAEESEWVDIGLRESTWDNLVRMMFLIIALIVILAGAIGVLRHGRSPRSRRALVRVATTLGITALGANLFFRESLTTTMLAGLAIAVLAVAIMLPAHEEPEEAEEAAGDGQDRQSEEPQP